MSESKTINREQVEKVHAELFATAKSIVDSGEEHRSLVFGYSTEGDEPKPELMADYPLDADRKRVLPLILHGIAKTLGLAVHVCEAWAVHRNLKDVKDEDDPLDGVPPSECDDKIEVVVMIFIGEDWKAFAQHKIDVVDGKRILAEGELVYEGNGQSFGGNLMGGDERRNVQ